MHCENRCPWATPLLSLLLILSPQQASLTYSLPPRQAGDSTTNQESEISLCTLLLTFYPLLPDATLKLNDNEKKKKPNIY